MLVEVQQPGISHLLLEMCGTATMRKKVVEMGTKECGWMLYDSAHTILQIIPMKTKLRWNDPENGGIRRLNESNKIYFRMFE
jgi:hypothetical protein